MAKYGPAAFAWFIYYHSQSYFSQSAQSCLVPSTSSKSPLLQWKIVDTHASGLAGPHTCTYLETSIHCAVLLSLTSFFSTKPIFYSCTMAFLSIAHSSLNLTIPHFTTLAPLYLIFTSFIFVLGWLAQWGIWMDCEIVSIAPSRRRPTCPNNYLAGTRRVHWLAGIEPSEVNLRVIFGGVALALYLALFVWSVAGQFRKNRVRKSANANNGGEVA